MTIDQKGIDLIKGFESFRNHPYLDGTGLPTIGYGTIIYPNGVHVTMNDPNISEQLAEHYLLNDLNHFEAQLDAMVQNPTQNQYNALLSFIYNLGANSLRYSTLLKLIKVNPLDPNIREQFGLWVHAGGKIEPGLVTRRAKEADVWFS
jgi:lysozyme